MKHWQGRAGVAVIALLAAACTSPANDARTGPPAVRGTAAVRGTPGASISTWWRPDINCGLPAMVRIAGRILGVGNCAGLFLVPADEVTLRVGDQIEVHMMELTPVFTLPTSSGPSVLQRIAVSPDGVTGTYRALRPGRAELVSDAWCVSIRTSQETKGSCPVLAVTVVPG